MNWELRRPPSVNLHGLGTTLLKLVIGSLLTVSVTKLPAAVTTVGAVPNAPPAGGGAVVGAFTIGELAFGSVTVTGGTAISNTGGATVANGVGGIGLVSLTGFGSDWTIGGLSSDLTLGDEGVGTASVANQAVLTVPDDTVIGVQSTGSGKLTVTGLGSVYDGGDDFTVGAQGLGIVEITNGGGLASDVVLVGDLATGRGIVMVSGEHSRWTATLTNIGDAGSGRLEVFDSGRFAASGDTNVGILAGGLGLIDVSGVGSLYSHGGPNFTLGNAGTGELQIRNGGLLTSASNINVAATVTSVGSITVDGAGSRLDITGNITTNSGDGQVTVSNGGVIATTTSSAISTTGRVTLAGGRWESTAASSAAISVSGLVQGSGVLDVQGVTLTSAAPRGRLQARTGDHLLLTGSLSNGGLVDQAGGELEVRGLLTNTGDIDTRNGAVLRVGGSGLNNGNGAQLAITGGSIDVFGVVNNNAGGEIAVVGGSTGVFHDAVTNNGTIFVSASSEIVMLENLGFAVGSELGVQLASIDPTADPTDAFGLVDISGAANLTGTLSVSLASGFTADLGDTYEVLRASGGRSGTFATESLPSLGGGLALDVQYTTNSVLLAVVAAGVPGDYNANGVVDAADYVLWRNGGPLANEVGTPGTVNAADYTAWRARFGNTSGSGAGSGATSGLPSSAVPEPETVIMFIHILAVICCMRRL